MREALFRRFMADKDVSADVSFPALAARTSGFSCADIANVCKDAAFGPFRDFTAQMHAEVSGVQGKSHCDGKWSWLVANLDVNAHACETNTAPKTLRLYCAPSLRFRGTQRQSGPLELRPR